MESTRPYLIRAIYEWAAANDLTPHLLVDTTQQDVSVPAEFVEDDKIVLNIAAGAVAELALGSEAITFNARFSGVAREIYIPTLAVRAIYASENGIGIVLPDEPDRDSDVARVDPAIDQDGSKSSHLRVIK